MKQRKKPSGDIQYQSVQEIVKVEDKELVEMPLSEEVASLITKYTGSMLYVFLHVVWFGIWIIFNMGFFGFMPFDPFPFSLLTMTVSLEAIFLSLFVLISQNKQAKLADKRAKIDLGIDMLAEKEDTKLMEMIEDIQKHLGIYKQEKEKRELTKKTDISALSREIDKAEMKSKRKV